MAEISVYCLAVLGAISGVIWLCQVFHNCYLYCRRLRNARSSRHSDFFYRTIDLGMRVSGDGKNVAVTRRAVITSKVKGLKQIRCGAGPTDTMSVAYRIIAGPCTIGTWHESQTHPTQVNFQNFAVVFNPQIDRNATVEFCVEVTATANEGHRIRPFNSWVSEHRVDHLILRVAFEGPSYPQKVGWSLADAEGHVQDEGECAPDRVSREARIEFRYLVPGLKYVLTWSPPQTDQVEAEPNGITAANPR